eukprot:6257503-Lingulodinium_polyedra.AAC.1
MSGPKRTASKYALCAEVKANGRNCCTSSSFVDGDGTGAETAGSKNATLAMEAAPSLAAPLLP